MEEFVNGLWGFLSQLPDFLIKILIPAVNIAFFAAAAYLIVQIVITSAELYKVSNIQKTFGLMNVEAEVEEVKINRWKKLLFQYEMRLSYSVYEREFSKKLVLFNKKLLAGTKVDLSFKPFKPEEAVLKDGSEQSDLKILLIVKILAIPAAYIACCLLGVIIFLVCEGFSKLFGTVFYFLYWIVFGKALDGVGW